MLSAALHAIGRDRPDPCLRVDRAPFRATRFARSRGGQNRELKSTRPYAFATAKRGHECAHVPVIERGMVLGAFYLACGGEDGAQVPFPSGGVLPLAVPAGGCPVEDRLDTASQPAGRLGDVRPDRLEDAHDV